MNPLRDYDPDNPHDDEYFLDLMRSMRRHGSRQYQGEETMWWNKKTTSVLPLQYHQMQALGRLVARAMTAGANSQSAVDEAGYPVLTLGHEQMSATSTEISDMASTILRREVRAYFSHFVTENEHSRKCRENIIILFRPPLTYNGTTVCFYFDRQAVPADVSVEDEQHGTA